ncbi:SDR family NAD(P)-dependent oxidoreductase [Lacibacterium aquatile]|uniref:SDR family NAD(P)-dependent oxidoreductase n=1 Tax=Lacibacterium aquatile TaxID=1168082 RepID=A0ABW5DVW8_9PROT
MALVGNLQGRRALVTGSSRGIGRAIALGLAAAGAEVIVHGITPSTAATETLSALGGKARFVAGNLADPDACLAIAKEAGPLDILILNASYEKRFDWRELPVEEMDRQWAVNVRASLILMQELVPGMEERGWGRIVSIGSIQEAKPNPRLALYAASKNAQTSLIRTLAKEVAGKGVTANNLAPGAISTDRNAEVLADAEYAARVAAQIPAGRVGTPEDCVGACLLLCSDAGSYINGASLYVDGGWHIA